MDGGAHGREGQSHLTVAASEIEDATGHLGAQKRLEEEKPPAIGLPAREDPAERGPRVAMIVDGEGEGMTRTGVLVTAAAKVVACHVEDGTQAWMERATCKVVPPA